MTDDDNRDDGMGAFHGLAWAAGLMLAGYAIIWLFYHFVLA